MIQFSDHILDNFVVPHLSELTRCGALALPRFSNYFREYLLRSAFGPNIFKPVEHALLTVFFRRIDYAQVEYSLGRKRLEQYCSTLPRNNSETRFVRLSVSHFETCLLHTEAAIRAMRRLLNHLGQEPPLHDGYELVRKFANRVRHFDEDPAEAQRQGISPSISPVWVSDTGLHSIAATITFAELKEILIAAMADAKEFASMLK